MVDEVKVIKAARKKLKQYSLLSARYNSFAPSTEISNEMEKMSYEEKEKLEATISRINALGQEVAEIEKAIEKMCKYRRGVLFSNLIKYRYVDTKDEFRKSHYIHKSGYCTSRYDELISHALLTFAETYRGGQLIIENE
ncbi:hypothetical protein [Floricoccus penangensis]|uniref:hypothetical protein n=1 Tax=Floricoccus penangensis TaxID=1859475 RepID=UPI00203C6363|nr:hypothetical protein [Floricoccus penangensis]URZ87205.1 hypothetical protein KIW23_08995 [Floricoccus penangensis]